MPKLKKLSGKEVISILNQFGFVLINQRGSHVKLRRTKDSLKETLLIPNHKEIDTGTLRAPSSNKPVNTFLWKNYKNTFIVNKLFIEV